MGVFSGIEQAKTFKKSPYIAPGQYTLSVRSLAVVNSKAGKSRVFFVAEFDVVASTNPEFQPGALVSWLVDMNNGDTSLSDVKLFASAILDCEEEEVTEAAMDKLTGPEQPATGIRVKANAFNIVTRAGADFTKIRWDSCTAED